MKPTRRGFIGMLAAALAAPVALFRKRTQLPCGIGERVLYMVGPTEEFATLRDAINQVWEDQGDREFTAEKTIRIAPGVYHEGVWVDQRLRPTDECPLIIEGAEEGGVLFDVPDGAWCVEYLGSGTMIATGFVCDGSKSKGGMHLGGSHRLS